MDCRLRYGDMPSIEYSYYVTRTARALELSVERPPVTAVSLAGELLVDTRTARRLLGRLADDGMLLRLGGKPVGFVPGPRLLALGEALNRRTEHGVLDRHVTTAHADA